MSLVFALLKKYKAQATMPIGVVSLFIQANCRTIQATAENTVTN